jgi:hypothetical protein
MYTLQSLLLDIDQRIPTPADPSPSLEQARRLLENALPRDPGVRVLEIGSRTTGTAVERRAVDDLDLAVHLTGEAARGPDDILAALSDAIGRLPGKVMVSERGAHVLLRGPYPGASSVLAVFVYREVPYGGTGVEMARFDGDSLRTLKAWWRLDLAAWMAPAPTAGLPPQVRRLARLLKWWLVVEFPDRTPDRPLGLWLTELARQQVARGPVEDGAALEAILESGVRPASLVELRAGQPPPHEDPLHMLTPRERAELWRRAEGLQGALANAGLGDPRPLRQLLRLS